MDQSASAQPDPKKGLLIRIEGKDALVPTITFKWKNFDRKQGEILYKKLLDRCDTDCVIGCGPIDMPGHQSAFRYASLRLREAFDVCLRVKGGKKCSKGYKLGLDRRFAPFIHDLTRTTSSVLFEEPVFVSMNTIDQYRPTFIGWVGFLLYCAVFLPHGDAASLGRPFITIPADQSLSGNIKDCQEDDIQSCQRVIVDFEALKEAQSFIVPNSHSVQLERVTKIDGDDDSVDSYFYEDHFGNEAILTVTNPESDHPRLTATINLHHKHAKPSETLHYIENCGVDCHVYIVEGSDKRESIIDGVQPDTSETEGVVPEDDPEDMDRQSTQAPTVINVMFYYTSEFEAVTSDIVGYVNQQIMATNLGYQMSDINLKARTFCIEKIANLRETGTPITLLQNFARLKRSRNSADIAILLLSKVKDNVCGIAYTDALRTRSQLSFGWIAKGCPSHTLGHEIGHTFGALHNREISQGSVPRGGYAYGNLINSADGTASGFHTIMAYTAQGYEMTVNCYSSPDVVCKGLVTGDRRNDVKRVLVARKSGMSRIGNERNVCRGLSASTSSTNTTTTTTTTPVSVPEDPLETTQSSDTSVTDSVTVDDSGSDTSTTTSSPTKGSSIVCRLCRRIYCVTYPAFCNICNRPCGA